MNAKDTKISKRAMKKLKQRRMQRVHLLKDKFSHWITVGWGACVTFGHFP